MVKHQFTEISNLNVVIKKLQDCEQRKSENGYFLVSETWGTCFFRVAHTRPTFEIQRFSAPKAERTYTKIPAEAYENVYHIYVNIHKYSFFTLNLPAGACIVGMADEQQSGNYFNYSFLVYSKVEPTVTEVEEQENQFKVKYERIDTSVKYRIFDLCPISGYGKKGHIKRISV